MIIYQKNNLGKRFCLAEDSKRKIEVCEFTKEL
jgi:hypothetical protein